MAKEKLLIICKVICSLKHKQFSENSKSTNDRAKNFNLSNDRAENFNVSNARAKNLN